jgi:hypothetical protein
MLRRRPFRLAAIVAVSVCCARFVGAAAGGVPARLTDQDFWTLVTELSEPGGTFRSENLLSNELRLQYVIPDLVRAVPRNRAYIGVGPEQNFTYIAAIQPSIAFIVDIRRGNSQLQLMYKALFELSADRADFVSRLFSRKIPDGLDPQSTARQIFDTMAVEPSDAAYERTLKQIGAQLTGKHGFPLSADDLKGIEHIFHAFYTFGPSINYSSSESDGTASSAGSYRPTYADLMTATDSESHARSYLASDEAFAFVKAMESRNLVVPVVGDFAGPRALRAVGAYLKSRSAVVSAFYVSNVEQYLRVERVWGSFCGNAAQLPIDDASTFIRAGRGGRYARGGTAMTHELTSIAVEVDGCDRRP